HHDADDDQKDSDVEEQRSAHEQMPFGRTELRPARGEKGTSERHRDEGGGERDQKPRAEQVPRVHEQRGAGRLGPVGEHPEDERHGHDQARHESASRLVVPAEQQERGQDEQERHEDATGRLENQRAHRRALSAAAMRRSAATPTAAVTSTVISPSVSSARKSTRITLTTLRPCAWVGAASAKKSRKRGLVGLIAELNVSTAIARPAIS